jgi:hypothetical protein
MNNPRNSYDSNYGPRHDEAAMYARHAAAQNARRMRVGLIPLVIGATVEHRLPRPTLIGGRVLPAASRVHSAALDITRTPEAAPHAKWICRSPHCAGQSWPTKAELIAGHAPHRQLVAQGETHLYYAIAEVPAVEAVPAKVDKDGNLIALAIDAAPARTLVLSDEE